VSPLRYTPLDNLRHPASFAKTDIADACQNNEIARLQKEVSEHKKREESSSCSNSEKEAELKRLLAREQELQGQLRKMCSALENAKASELELSEQLSAAKSAEERCQDNNQELTRELYSARAAYNELATGMNAEMSKIQEEQQRREKEREDERRRLALEKQRVEEGLNAELRRAREEAEREVERIENDRLEAMVALEQVKDAVKEEGVRAKKDLDGVKEQLQSEVSEARALAAKFASEREQVMVRMQEAMREQEAERAKLAKGSAAQLQVLQEALEKERSARTMALDALKKAEGRRQSTESLLAAAERSAEEARAAREQASLELREGKEKSERDLKAAELKTADLFKKVREIEAAKRGVDKQLAEANASTKSLQASLDELQARMVLLHESSSSSQSKLQQEYEAAKLANKQLTAELEKLLSLMKQTTEGRDRDEAKLRAALEAKEQELSAKEHDFTRREAVLKLELAKEKQLAKGLEADLEAKLAHGMAEVERVKANLKASDTEIALSAKKYRELEAQLKEAEAQVLKTKVEVARLVKELQSKSDALTSLDGLGQRSKEVLGVIQKLQTASDAMESAVTCFHCLGPLKACVTVVPCGHNLCGGCWNKAKQVGSACPECGDETMDHAKNDALDQLASKFTFQKQALETLLNDPVFASVNAKA
jgi:hypothetical protein